MDKPVVLVVDDEVDARNTIIDFLEARYDCKYREAKDGEEAVHFVKSSPCDVMSLDIQMPKKGGRAVIKESKEIQPVSTGIIGSMWSIWILRRGWVLEAPQTRHT